MKNRLGRYSFLLLVSVIGAFALVLIVKGIQFYIQDQELVATPVSKVKERRALVESKGISLKENSEGTDTRILVSAIARSDWAKKHGMKNSSLQLGEELVASEQVKVALVQELAVAPTDTYKWPVTEEFQTPTTEQETQRATGSLKLWIDAKLKAGQYDEAITGLELLDNINQLISRSRAERAIIFWFGLNVDILQFIHHLNDRGALTPARLAKVRPMLDFENRTFNFRNMVNQRIRESVAVARDLPNLSVNELYSIASKDDFEFEPVFDERTALAAESKLLNAWHDILNCFSPDKNEEVTGVEIDKVIVEHHKNKKLTDFMVLALPDTFEQHGRLVYRVIQAKALMQLWLDEKLGAGKKEIDYGTGKLLVEVESAGSQWRASTKSMFAGRGFKTVSGLQVSQSEGVQLVVPK